MPAQSDPIMQAYRYVVRVTPEQEERLLSFTGSARFAFNWGLALVKGRLDARERGEEPQIPWSYYSLYTEWRKVRDEVAPWRQEVPCTAFLTGLEGVGRALQGFSRARKAGRRAGFPHFRAKGRVRERIFFMRDDCRPIDSRHVRVPKLGLLYSRERLTKLNRILVRDPNARIVRATLTRKSEGKWFVSFTVERSPKARRPRRPECVVGVDLGLRQLATLSTGEQVRNPRPLATVLRRLSRMERQLDRQRRAANPGNYLSDGRVKPGRKSWARSQRMARTEDRIRRLHERASNLRKESAHQLTSALTREFGMIGVESLNVAGMLGDRRISRSLSDASLGRILSQLSYKASWSGVTLVPADRFYPSSKTCSGGEVVFACDECGLVMDRDLNAARNLAILAFKQMQSEGRSPYLAPAGGERLNARGGQVRPASLGSGRSSTKREDSLSSESSRPREGSAVAAPGIAR
jgi:putative transposase